MKQEVTSFVATIAAVTLLAGCGSGTESSGASPGGRERSGRETAGTAIAVPVQVAAAERRSLSLNLETNGVLEAENTVDVVARVSGPIAEILVEEGMRVAEGQLLARIDDRELRNQVTIAKVSRDEAQLAFDRASSSWKESVISQEAYDIALNKLESTKAQLETRQIQLDYAEIRAPFAGLIVTRYIKPAQNVGNGTPLFHLTDFDPLLCPIEVPEKELGRLGLGQRASLAVEAFPGERFSASVLRMSPIVDAATGTVRVTLQVAGSGKLRPGMFASVELEMETHHNTLAVPKSALVLGSLGDAVFVRANDVASRRAVKVGIRQAETVEILDGLASGDEVVVLGQEGLSDGTPITVISGGKPAPQPESGATSPPSAEVLSGQTQRAKTDSPPAGDHQQADRRRSSGPPGSGGMPPQMLERLRKATPEELERMKQRMRERGMSDQQIEGIIKAARESSGNTQ